ncbi:MAG: hypothetical protein AAGB22_03180, partial [Bacteroidota bacterium]
TGTGSGGWVTASHDLVGLGGQSSVLVRVTFGSDGSGQDDGVAFDNIIIREKPADDLGIADVLSPSDGCALGLENLSVAVQNFGAAAQAVYSVSFRVNGGSIITQSFTTDTVPAVDTLHLAIDSLIDLSTPGPNNVEVWTTLAGDIDNSNDTLAVTITHELAVINTFPHLEDFESLAPGASGSLANGWQTVSTTGNFGWEAENSSGGNENSTGTGPFFDHTTEGTAGGMYMYLETSSGATNEEDELVSPCIDLAGLSNPRVEFWYHLYGAATGDLHFEVNSGGTWTTEATISGQQQTGGGDPWLKQLVNMDAYAGQVVKIRFRGNRTNTFTGDMSVDDIRIFDAPLNDAGITALDLPVGPIIAPGLSNVEVSIRNFGADTLVSATVNWMVNGATQTPFSYTGALPTDSTDSNVNIGSFNFPAGLNMLTFYTSMPNGQSDDDNNNDTLNAILCTPLTGTITIGPTGDFPDMVSAVAALNQCGISGPVTFNVQMGAGPFTGQVVFQAVTGASATNTVTFNGNGATIQHTASSSDRRVVGFDGAKHITLDSFYITSLSTTDGYGIHFQNNSDSNTVRNCFIQVDPGFGSTSSIAMGGIVSSGSNTSMTLDGDNAKDLLIENNRISSGYYGIILSGSLGTAATGMQILNNVIEDFYHNGISLDELDGALVEGNDISRATRSNGTTFEGITLESGSGNANNLIQKNRIHNTHDNLSSLTGTSYGLYSTSNDAPAGMSNQFINNVIYNFNSNGTNYGIYNTGSNNVTYWHNTVSLNSNSSTGGTNRGFYQTTTASGIDFRNNVVSVIRTGSGTKHCLYFNATGSTINSDFNALYIDTTIANHHTGRYTTDHKSMTDWQAANSGAFDQSSVFGDPVFANAVMGDLTPANPLIDNIGFNLAVADDINGTTRGATPDPGAFEFEVQADNLGLIEILSPSANAVLGCTYGSAEPITFVVQNSGSVTVTSFTATFNLGITPFMETFSGLSIGFGESDTLTFTPTGDLSGQIRRRTPRS